MKEVIQLKCLISLLTSYEGSDSFQITRDFIHDRSDSIRLLTSYQGSDSFEITIDFINH